MQTAESLRVDIQKWHTAASEKEPTVEEQKEFDLLIAKLNLAEAWENGAAHPDAGANIAIEKARESFRNGQQLVLDAAHTDGVEASTMFEEGSKLMRAGIEFLTSFDVVASLGKLVPNVVQTVEDVAQTVEDVAQTVEGGLSKILDLDSDESAFLQSLLNMFLVGKAPPQGYEKVLDGRGYLVYLGEKDQKTRVLLVVSTDSHFITCREAEFLVEHSKMSD